MTSTTPPLSPPDDLADDAPEDSSPACVLLFNASDPSGAGGLTGDITAVASVGGHPVAVVTGAYARDTAEVFDHFPFDDDAVAEQARAVLEDLPVQAIKVGFAGSPENLGAIAQIASDYAEVPVVAYMPDLSWWDELAIETYLDACVELLLPQTTVLVGNHSTLCRWLLPEWEGDRPPNAREVARAAAVHGVPYTLVTGFNAADQYLESHLASPEAVLATARYERFEATFGGAGDTLSAALCALIAAGADLQSACAEALTYLDQCLDAGFQPGMGHAVPDRLFWAHEDEGDEAPEGAAGETPSPDSQLDADDFPLDTTKH